MGKIIVDETALTDTLLYAERINALAEQLAQGYLSDGHGDLGENKCLLEVGYENSRILCEMVRDFSCDARKALEELINNATLYRNTENSKKSS